MDDEALRRKLAALREAYLAEGPQRLAELWSAFARVQNGDLGALDDLTARLHRLAGSGGSYGLMDVTTQARAGELAAYAMRQSGRPLTDEERSRLRLCIEKLAGAFASAANPE